MSARVTTFRQAEELGAFELAALWADRRAWRHEPHRDAADELSELAVMSALQAWLQRWRPIHIHRALLAGAEVARVCAAMDAEPGQVTAEWCAWADPQRRLVICGRPGVTAHEYRIVAGRLDAAITDTATEEGR